MEGIERPVSELVSADRWIRWTTTGAVLVLAAIAAVVSFRHMRELALAHGEDALAAALIPLAVDGTIVAASMSLLRASRHGSRGGLLPWALLIISSLASIGANVAVAEPTMIARLIAGWPSLALIGAYEMLMCQVRQTSSDAAPSRSRKDDGRWNDETRPVPSRDESASRQSLEGERALQRTAWEWASTMAGENGALPTGQVIARQFERSPRWGRLVKKAGRAGELG
ncbi:hypothetical protein GCM10022419_045580 [Nonomuraea rosea]|uniref:DUF2637 domain-containing protein n=1 Tax=Nonomuraea rosea TaxID=638574 RepID=A0ABP6X2N7_9ACTN